MSDFKIHEFDAVASVLMGLGPTKTCVDFDDQPTGSIAGADALKIGNVAFSANPMSVVELPAPPNGWY